MTKDLRTWRKSSVLGELTLYSLGRDYPATEQEKVTGAKL